MKHTVRCDYFRDGRRVGGWETPFFNAEPAASEYYLLKVEQFSVAPGDMRKSLTIWQDSVLIDEFETTQMGDGE